MFVLNMDNNKIKGDLIVKKKEFCGQAATYVSSPERASIMSDEGLSFRVRNGAGRFPLSIAT